jgi:type I restriction enzyme S subunit
MSGAVEARELIRQFPREELAKLTEGFSGGIFKAPRLSPCYVTDLKFGHKYLSSTDILWSDLTYVPLISNDQAREVKDYYVRKGMTLVSSSGETGRTAYARGEMDGMMGSPHFMRINPSTGKISPGYLYAFLSSKYGNALMISGTYGSIIQAIEPHHISDLPVPRFNGIEGEVHSLIEEAAACRDKASVLLQNAISKYEELAGLRKLNSSIYGGYFGIRTVSSKSLSDRLDGLFHSAYHNEAIEALAATNRRPIKVSDIAMSLFEPLRLKRVQVDDPEFGLPFFGTSEIMWAEPVPKYLISRKQEHIDTFVVTEKTVLVPRSGQLSGIIGTPVLPYGALIGGAVSEHAIRIQCKSATDAGFLFIALKSEHGRRQLKSRAYGSSIPTLDVNQVGNVQVPDVAKDRTVIGQIAVEATGLRHKAINLEKQAIRLVEKAIEEGGR